MTAVKSKRRFGCNKCDKNQIKSICHRYGETLAVGQRIIRTQKQKLSRNASHAVSQLPPPPFLSFGHKERPQAPTNMPLQAVKKNLSTSRPAWHDLVPQMRCCRTYEALKVTRHILYGNPQIPQRRNQRMRVCTMKMIRKKLKDSRTSGWELKSGAKAQRSVRWT